MKTLAFTTCICILIGTSCTDNSFSVPDKSLSKDLVHFGIYIEFLPDSTLNQDERCWQAHDLRLQSRAGYDITFYQVYAPPKGEAVARYGTTNPEGNYNAHDLAPATYRIIAEDQKGITQEAIITPAKGEITRKTFSFYIPKD